MVKILVLSCSLNAGSRSRLLARAAAARLADLPGVRPSFRDLRGLDLPLCDGDAAFGAPDVGPLAEAISGAGGVLLGVPIYNFDVNAAAKNAVELTGRAWEGKVVGFLCAAGGRASYMAPMGLASTLMLDFRCLVVPRFVFATASDFEGERIASEEVKDRVGELCAETVRLAAASRRGRRADGPPLSG